MSAPDALAGLSAEKRALLARRLREEGGAARILLGDPVAVVGLGCRLPGGVRGPDALWRLLREGRDAVGGVPGERWTAGDAPGAPARGGFLDAVDAFDAAFFGIPPREAACMDPQQRIFLEVVWEALEDAGKTRAGLAGSRTGVFAGLCIGDFGRLLMAERGGLDAYAVSGTADSIAANRVSYLLDLRGPSVAVDTACSSSLVAVHLACQSLRTGECDLAVAGGVNAILAPEVTLSLARWGVLSPGGACRAFDASADGFVRAEGCGAVVLKRLSDTLEAGDRVLAVIRGSAINQDGRSNGLTAPSIPAQEAVIRAALENAGIEPGRVSYVETHGTGTALGDPVELEALARVFGPAAEGRTVALGAAKSALGHLEAAAGVTGLIKAVLALRHGEIPPNLHFGAATPAFDWSGAPFRVPTAPLPWPSGEPRRCAGVSAMGFGGTNAHVVLEEAPPAASASASIDGPLLLALSARSEAALARRAEQLRGVLLGDDAPDARELCFTAGARRTHHEHRLAVVGATREELARGVDAALRGEAAPAVARGTAPARPGGVAFVFSGQGSVWAGMGRGLLEGDPAFRDAVERFDAAFRREAGWSVADALRSAPAERLARTSVAQPAICAVQLGVAASFAARGIVPDAALGHSVGEIAAACVAGVLSVEDAARVAYHRARLMEPAAGRGAMAAAALTPGEAAALLAETGGEVWVAAVNAPALVSLAGEPGALARAVEALAARGVWHRRLEVDHAFHTPQVAEAEAALPSALAGLAPSVARLPLYSTVTGRRAAADDYGAAYWARNVRQPVRFSDAVAAALADGCTALVEVGPHPVLQRALQECAAAFAPSAHAIATLRRGADGATALLSAVARLHVLGHSPDWDALFPGGVATVDLPPYPWDHVRFPIPRSATPSASIAGNVGMTITGASTNGHAHPSTDPVSIDVGMLTANGSTNGHAYPSTDPVSVDEGMPTANASSNGYAHSSTDRVSVDVGMTTANASTNGYAHPSADPVSVDAGMLTASASTNGQAYPSTDSIPIDGAMTVVGASPNGHAGRSTEAADGGLYEVTWREADPAAGEARRGAGTWIVLADEGGVGDEVVRLLRARGDRCIRVLRADAFARTGDDELAAAPADADDFRRVVEHAAAGGAPLHGALHLWAMDAAPPADADRLDADVERACAPALHLARALAASPRAGGARLWLATRGAQPATDAAGASAPAQAPLWGLGHVIALEHPALAGGLVDLPERPSPADAAALVAELSADPPAASVALRGGRRLTLILVPTPADSDARVAIRADGSYLVTGGLGALGRATARWLAERGAGAVILLGRRGASADASAFVAELEALGARVRIAAADVADAEGLAAALRGAMEGLPPLRGVVHAAGVTGDAALERLGWERFRAVLAPRVRGTWNLHRATEGAPLDFRVAFSSMAALYGAPGQGAYAAACAFPDAFARATAGWTSIGWGPWSGGGMFASLAAETAERRRGEGIGEIAPDDGVRLLVRALAGGRPYVAALPIDWPRFAARSPLARTGPLPAGIRPAANPASATDLAARVEGAPASRRRALVLACVREETARVLGAASVDPATGFADLGLDSLMTVELRGRLQARSGRPLGHTAVFDYPSPAELAAHLDALLAPPVDTATGEDGGSVPIDALHPPPSTGNDDDLELLDEAELEGRLAAALAALDTRGDR